MVPSGPHPDGLLLVDGRADAGVPGDDPGLLLGLTVFETFRSYGARGFRLEHHLERFLASCDAMEVPHPGPAEVLAEWRRFLGPDQWMRYTCTAGGHRVIHTGPVDPTRVGRGVRLATLRWSPPPELPGEVKHGSRAAWELAARRARVDEVLLVSPEGQVLEASRSNVWLLQGHVAWTPALDGRQLAGVTRGAMLDAAAAAGLEVREAVLRAEDLELGELYVSSTLKELAPVVHLDGRDRVGGGPAGRRLHAAFQELVRRECA